MAITNLRPKYVSFDCYGTLMNWILTHYPSDCSRAVCLKSSGLRSRKVFRGYRFDEVSGDYKPYEQILQDSFDRVCKRWGSGPTKGAGAEFAEAVHGWGAHEDVPAPRR